MRSISGHRGFTLIELLIVIAIIGILVAIAIPNYNEHIIRARITEAVTKLSDMRVRMEQYFQDNRSYAGACTAGTLAPLPANTDYFQFSCNPVPDATTYTVIATGIGKMAGFVYTLDQNNVRATTGVPAGWVANASCWVTSKGGGCS